MAASMVASSAPLARSNKPMAVGTRVMAAAAAYSPQVDGPRQRSPRRLAVLLTGDGEDLDRPAPPDQRVEQRPLDPVAPPGALGLADHDAVHVVRLGVRQNLVGDALAAHRHRPPAEQLRELQRAERLLAIGRAEALVPRGFHVQRHPLGVKPRGHPPGGPRPPHRGPARADADQEPFRRRPGLPNAALRHVPAHLGVHPLRRAAERQLPQGDQVSLCGRTARWPGMPAPARTLCLRGAVAAARPP